MAVMEPALKGPTSDQQVGRILKAANPADLRVLNSTNLDVAANLTTAKSLGLELPPSIMLRANVVIE
jgi:putative tryptophan/tyrosine transport system substrate-binding protein